ALACMGSQGSLQNWSFWNSYPQDLNLVRMKVSFTSNAKISSVSVNTRGNTEKIYDGKNYFDDNGILRNGKAPAGKWFPILDGKGFVIKAGEATRTGTSKIDFEGSINSNDKFVIEFMFSDGSILTTPSWPVGKPCN
ncbi:MAG: hypothetical protein N3F05_02225, partial [Candidatus Diapherotrites archaeon]|nr:hypothetical protein [Candidatus Diapherotrites archaeon]